MFESILIILGIMLFCAVVLSPFYFFRKNNTASISSGAALDKNKTFYWSVFVISAVFGSQAYSWFSFSTIFSAIVQIIAVFAGIFSVRKIWTKGAVQEAPKEISGQKSGFDKMKKYLAVFIFIVLSVAIIIPRFIAQNLKSEINMEELKINFEKSEQELDVLRQGLYRMGLMSALEKQEGKPFEKIPMNVIKDFLNQNGN